MPFARAAREAGVSEHTANGWLRRGRRERESVYGEFARRVDGATARAAELRGPMDEAELVGLLWDAARRGSWRAAAWLLERGWPGAWAKLSERKSASSRDEPARKAPADAFGEADELASRRAQRGG